MRQRTGESARQCSNCKRRTFDFVVEQTGGLCVLCTWDQHRKDVRPAEFQRKSRRAKKPAPVTQEQISDELYYLLEHCESYCLVTCCGLNAVDLSSDNISEWISQCGETDCKKLLDYLADFHRRLQREFRTVDFIGDPWPPSLLRLWVRELQEILRIENQEVARRRSEPPNSR